MDKASENKPINKSKKHICIGLLAHVDAGKTTLSEGMLYLAGNIRKLGRVDHKDAFFDNYELERERGITIFSKQAVLNWKDVEISLLDTPGHIDFSAEMERTLQVLDYAILVISGTDGVQGHTETLWNLLRRYNIPVFIFVNKMDIASDDQKEIIEELKIRLSDECIDFSGGLTDEFYENIAMSDEEALNLYMENGLIETSEIRKLISDRKIFPCYFGSALKMEGVENFVDGMCLYADFPVYNDKFGAKVYKIARDEQGMRLTYLKVTGGKLKVKEILEDENEKIEQIRIYSGAKYKAVDVAEAGMVCAVTGLTKTYPGECLGEESSVSVPLLEPVMTYKIIPEQETDMHQMLINLKMLEEEDPQLHIVWNEQLQEINAQLMGEVQIEVLKRLVWDRFHQEIEFGHGNIVYKETIADTVEGVGHFEPLKHYAEVHLLLEPGERDSGLVFSSDCKEDELDRNWQRLILTHLDEREHPGVLTGSAITDIKITLIAGRAHLKHTEGGDFRQATYRAVRQGLMQAESILLEPYYDFRLEVPPECTGRAINDIQRLNGSFEGPDLDGGLSVLTGEIPVAMLTGYISEVNSYTGGRGRLTCHFKGYRPCSRQEEIVGKLGYNPDEDVNNPTGSVFCAHGSGFYVPWYDVKNYMHLEGMCLEKDGNEDKSEGDYNTAKVLKGTFAGSYSGTIEEDRELEAIFERTFGSVAKRVRSDTAGVLGYQSGRSKKSKRELEDDEEYMKSYARYHKTGNKDSKSYLLVDGYNIIFSWEELNELSKVSLDAARGRLMDILCNYQGFRQCITILVFDAYKVKGNPGELSKYHNINVVYTKEAETADMYIEKVTHEIGKKHNVTVATSDALEQIIVAGEGAKRMSAGEFRQEVERVSEQIKEIIENDS